jgi:glycosyltransferase involved in cell wall biosynthesis
MSDALAIAWTAHRRTTGLCAGLGLELIVLRTDLRGPARFLPLSLRTAVLLLRRRPRILLVPNPSLVLSVLAVSLRPVLRYRLVVDAHNEAVVPFIHQGRWLQRLSRWVLRRADLTLVTNRALAAVVETQGGQAFTLPDPIPQAPSPLSPSRLQGEFNAVLISTFAPDEPVADVFEAVRGLSIDLYVTGDHRKLDPVAAKSLPSNVHLTGFLPEVEYWKLLQSADALIDLTLMDNCLVCGAYEALSAGKPMLLSNNVASIELFGDSALYTNNAPNHIRRMLEQLREERGRLENAVSVKRAELTALWAARAQGLSDILQRWARAAPARTAV